MAITDTPEVFFEVKQPSSMQRLSIAAAALKDVTDPSDVWLAQYDPSRIPGDHSYLTLQGIQRQYDERHRLDVWAAGFAEDAKYSVKAALFMAQFIPAARLPAKIGLAIGRAGADQGLTAALDHLKEHGFEETSVWLNQPLLRLRDEGQLGDLSDIQRFTPKERMRFLEQSRIIDDLMNAAVSEKDKPLMREMALRVLDDRLKKGIEIQGEYDAAQDAELAIHERQIAAVSASLRTFMDETQDDLKTLYATQADLQNQVDALAGRVDRNSSDIQFLQSFMFDKMNPTEQLNALKSGFFQNMPAAEREKLETKIALVEGRQKLMAAVGAYAEGASAVARIASRVGVDQNVVDVIQKTAQIASVASGVATGFMTGGLGYLAAADAVTGLIFGSGSDVGAARQQQIMQALAQISGQLDEIRQMLVEVQKGINIIIENQRQLYDGLVNISHQIDENYRATMTELSLIRQDLGALKSMTNEILDTNIGACPIFQDRLTSDRFSISWVRFLEACFGFSRGVIVAYMSDYRHKRPNVSSLLYHIVCPAKYRRVIFDTEVDTVLKDVCLDIAQRYEIAFLEIGTDKDHVHFLVQSVPSYSPTKIVHIIKSLTAREIFHRVPTVKKRLWGGEFWSKGSFISTVGRQGNEEVIRHYVRQQGQETSYAQLHRQDIQLGLF